MQLPDSYYRSLAKTYDKKRMFLLTALEELGFECPRPEGAYYIFADFKELSKLDDYEFAADFARTVGVAVVPGSSFYANREGGKSRVRFTFTKKDKTLQEAVKRMRKKLT